MRGNCVTVLTSPLSSHTARAVHSRRFSAAHAAGGAAAEAAHRRVVGLTARSSLLTYSNAFCRSPRSRARLPTPAAPAQLRLLDTLTSRLLRPVANLEVCRRARVSASVLALLRTPPTQPGDPSCDTPQLAHSLGALLGAVLAHHTSVADLRQLVALLRSPQQPYVHLALLEALEAAAQPSAPGPRARFDFSGPLARIELGHIDPFPEDAVTFWLWIRLEVRYTSITHAHVHGR